MTIPRHEAVRRLRSKLPKIHRRWEAHSTDFDGLRRSPIITVF